MSDITKCAGKKCKVKKQCYRYTAKSGLWQSWSNFWEECKGGACENFWDNGRLTSRKETER